MPGRHPPSLRGYRFREASLVVWGALLLQPGVTDPGAARPLPPAEVELVAAAAQSLPRISGGVTGRPLVVGCPLRRATGSLAEDAPPLALRRTVGGLALRRRGRARRGTAVRLLGPLDRVV